MSNMHAVQFTSFGCADVLTINQVPVPVAAPGEVLVRVRAAGINHHDLINRSGAMKFIMGRKFPFGTGLEFAGNVVAGEAFAAGQMVWGSVPAMKPRATGAMAEYVVVPADRVSTAPADLSAIEAASLVVSTTTAYRGLHELGQIASGDRVLIRGAAGGVGLAAVQVAVAAGAAVTALSSARDFEVLRELGAKTTLDYRATRIGDLGSFELIFDTVGTSMLAYRRHLARNGRMVTIVFSSFSMLLSIGVSAIFGAKKIRAFSSDAKAELLEHVRDLAESGHLRAMIASTYPLASIAQAHRDQEKGGVLGKRVITLPS
ncbi:NAD(P)-dependent alcohol dehydrogenase [Subtercola boreus]|nr:NAD(P)-dependent alcohol dehydrogenase [Subtercola boreus]